MKSDSLSTPKKPSSKLIKAATWFACYITLSFLSTTLISPILLKDYNTQAFKSVIIELERTSNLNAYARGEITWEEHKERVNISKVKLLRLESRLKIEREKMFWYSLTVFLSTSVLTTIIVFKQELSQLICLKSMKVVAAIVAICCTILGAFSSALKF